jgi:transcriptional regulator with XRE-family HTH domain
MVSSVANDRSPRLARLELGRRLRDLRAGRKIKDVAEAIGVSGATISRIETGVRPATRRSVLALCQLYGVEESLREQLLDLADQASRQGWWDRYEDIEIDQLIGLEIDAVRIGSYNPFVIPWIFQTKEYARSAIKGAAPRMADNVLGDRVEARLTRQQILTRQPPSFRLLVDESAIRRRVGGVQVMRHQLDRMVELAALPQVSLQVVPFSLGAHPGVNAFTLLEFMAPQPAVVYIESTAGDLYLERQSDIERHQEYLDHLQAGALDPDKSLRVIDDIKEKLES